MLLLLRTNAEGSTFTGIFVKRGDGKSGHMALVHGSCRIRGLACPDRACSFDQSQLKQGALRQDAAFAASESHTGQKFVGLVAVSVRPIASPAPSSPPFKRVTFLQIALPACDRRFIFAWKSEQPGRIPGQ
jgi:hypothetical protein